LGCLTPIHLGLQPEILVTANETAASNGGRFFVTAGLTVKRRRFLSTKAAIVTITNVTAISHGTS
jgi:hypothetical protein